jgi:hypothetical protein
MTAADEYRVRETKLKAKAKQETDPMTRLEYERLARSYLRLAEHAEKFVPLDFAYETPPPKQSREGKRGR